MYAKINRLLFIILYHFSYKQETPRAGMILCFPHATESRTPITRIGAEGQTRTDNLPQETAGLQVLPLHHSSENLVS